MQADFELEDALRGHGVDVRQSPDLTRIRALPRSSPHDVAAYSRALRRYGDDDRCPHHTGESCKLCGGSGVIALRDDQAAALHASMQCSGLFAHMQVGSGKTLVTLAAPVMFGSLRPVMLLPSSMFRKSPKTQRDYARYQLAWRVRLPRLVSYQELGHPRNEHRLFELQPDLLIMDEADALRNVDASVTRRVKRYLEAHPDTIVMALSGTLITGDLLDYHHHAVWALGDAAPVPIVRAEAERWSQASASLERARHGDVQDLPGGLSSWIRGTAGVVATEGVGCPASIEVTAWRPDLPDDLRRIITSVAASHMRPDGELLEDLDLPDCLSQLAQGFFYIWDPMPPDWWLRPRRAWAAYIALVLALHLPGFDSPSMVRDALDAGGPVLPPEAAAGRDVLAAWRTVKDEFIPHTRPIWITDSIMRQAIARARPGTLMWTGYRASGHLLDRLGVPYYGGGTDPEAIKGTPTIALSIASHGVGRNLQAWHRAMFLSIPANARQWEQTIGREHRPGQRAPRVYVDIIQAIDYHSNTIARVLTAARKDSRASGFDHKLLAADWTTT